MKKIHIKQKKSPGLLPGTLAMKKIKED